MIAINRVATEVNAGGVTAGGGLGIEVAKNVDELPSFDIMLIDWLFWTDAAHLNTGGLIAFIGLAVMLHGSYRANRERKRRERTQIK